MKFQLPKFSPRQLLILTHDLGATALALIGAFFLRFDASGLVDRLPGLLLVLPSFLVVASVVYHFTRLHRGKWRFASLPDLDGIVRASTILALALLVFDYVLVAPNILGTFFFGKLTIIVYWLLQMFFLGGPRMAYRYFRYMRDRNRAKTAGSFPTLILGRAADVEVLLRSIESGAVTKIWPAGVLSPSPADRDQQVRELPYLAGSTSLIR